VKVHSLDRYAGRIRAVDPRRRRAVRETLLIRDFKKLAASHATPRSTRSSPRHYTAHAIRTRGRRQGARGPGQPVRAKSEPSLAGEVPALRGAFPRAAEALRELAMIPGTLAKEHAREEDSVR
jgi:hypothetical protein